MREISSLIPSIYNKFIELHNAEKFSKFNPEVTVNEGYYLDILYHLGSSTFTEFAEKAQITKPAATQIIKKLIEKGYVEKNQCKKDRRVYYIKTSDVINKHFKESDIYLENIYKNCSSFLSKDEKNDFKKILSKIDNSLAKINQNEKNKYEE